MFLGCFWGVFEGIFGTCFSGVERTKKSYQRGCLITFSADGGAFVKNVVILQVENCAAKTA